MTSRATTLVDFNGDHIQLPNATIYKNAIRNFTANPNIRASCYIGIGIGIGYDTDFDYAQSLVENFMKQHPAILEESAPQYWLTHWAHQLVIYDFIFAFTVKLTVS